MKRRKPTRIAINRARLHAGLPAIRVTQGERTRHARLVKVLGPCIVAQVTYRGKTLAYVVTDAELELVR